MPPDDTCAPPYVHHSTRLPASPPLLSSGFSRLLLAGFPVRLLTFCRSDIGPETAPDRLPRYQSGALFGRGFPPGTVVLPRVQYSYMPCCMRYSIRAHCCCNMHVTQQQCVQFAQCHSVPLQPCIMHHACTTAAACPAHTTNDTISAHSRKVAYVYECCTAAVQCSPLAHASHI